MAQGPFRGVAGALARALGGIVSVTPLGGVARSERAIFRKSAAVVSVQDGIQVENYLPILRGPANVIGDLVEGSTVDPGEGQVYTVDYLDPTNSSGPTDDSNITLVLTAVQS